MKTFKSTNLLLRLLLLREWRVEVLEDFCVDDIERHGQARGLVGQGWVGDQYGDLAGVSNSGEGDI
jgi:hypothetical protein